MPKLLLRLGKVRGLWHDKGGRRKRKATKWSEGEASWRGEVSVEQNGNRKGGEDGVCGRGTSSSGSAEV